MLAREEISLVSDARPYVATVVLAFGADPFVRWLFPDPDTFVRSFTEITTLHADRTAANGGAYARTDGRAAAFWYAPGIHPDGDALMAVLERGHAAMKMRAVWPEVVSYEPQEPHWYLRQIAVDPAMQGSGYGSQLLSVSLAHIDEQGGLAYLEATSEQSKRLYERHGFRALAEVSADGSPPLWPMVRTPFEPQ